MLPRSAAARFRQTALCCKFLIFLTVATYPCPEHAYCTRPFVKQKGNVRQARLQQYRGGAPLGPLVPASTLWEGGPVAILVIRRPA